MIPILRRLTGTVKIVEPENIISVPTNHMTPLEYGDTAPDFSISTISGLTTTLSRLIEESPVVLSFFRGGWCPTCNLEINALEEEVDAFEIKNIKLIGVTPDTIEEANTLKNERKISFDLISDPTNSIATLFDIVVPLKDALPTIHHRIVSRKIGKPIEECYVPIPATYIIDRTGRIILAHVDFDYTKRIRSSELVEMITFKDSLMSA